MSFNLSIRDKRLRQNCINLEQAFKRYLREESPKKRGSISTDKHLKVVWLDTNLKSRKLSAISVQCLSRIRDRWLVEGFSPATVVRRLAIISHLFTVAIRDWGMNYINDPTKKVTRPKVDNARKRRVINNVTIEGKSLSEVEWVIRNTRSKTLPNVVTLALETGMRRSELVSIKKDHINFDEGFIHVPYTKNGRDRNIPLSPWAKFSLIEHLISAKPRGKIFNISAGAVTRSFIRAVERTRKLYENYCSEKNTTPNGNYFNDLKFHDLRHEAISRLAKIYEMHELATISGHADTRMLLRYYHPSVKHLVQKLANSDLGRNQFSMIGNKLLERV